MAFFFLFFFFFLILPLYAFRIVGQAFGGISVEGEAPPPPPPRRPRKDARFGLVCWSLSVRFFFSRCFRRKKNLFPLFVTVTGLKLLGINVPAYSLRGKSALLECR